MSTVLGFEIVNVGTKTPRATVVVADSLPDVPVIVSVLLPTLAVLLAVSVNVLKFVAGLGEKEAVTPLGSPDTASDTLPLNP